MAPLADRAPLGLTRAKLPVFFSGNGMYAMYVDLELRKDCQFSFSMIPLGSVRFDMIMYDGCTASKNHARHPASIAKPVVLDESHWTVLGVQRTGVEP